MRRAHRRRFRAAARSAAKYVVLDSSGLSGLIGRSERARAQLRWVVEHGGSVLVPSPVLAETITGQSGRDSEINRILGVLQRGRNAIVAPDEATARLAGRLRFQAGTDDGIDALVAAAAALAGGPSVLLTSDADDLLRLLAGYPTVAVRIV